MQFVWHVFEISCLICLVVGVHRVQSWMQQMVRKLRVQQCYIPRYISKDCTSNVNVGWFGDDWREIGRGHKFSIVCAELSSLTVELVYTLFNRLYREQLSCARLFRHSHAFGQKVIHVYYLCRGTVHG